ncbi:copper homeostasis protein [Ulvibacter sp. MAR_2010_11]|uniref:copper homeostasis protein CutC n=1 Tax=Ulvibacter sp. MAR_2010_11 TaxID=1250229 RepID=UPI000C2B660C|nr:copper homeostasis protein CutC [Ulvibacter sp. MAR_2010_11]PKA83020.1 copper homeostasis protein [Ulvibacter sp. MAR_2010_11]
MLVEICANSFESAKAAQDGGADRIELCTELSVGGLTPSHGLIEKVMAELTIPVHVLIRPRSGNFTYSQSEVEVMLKDIAYCKKLWCSGVVCGALTTDSTIDVEITQHLLYASQGLEFTFHRAFDWCKDPMSEIKSLGRMGVDRILSSGQQAKAIDGIDVLKDLKNSTKGLIEIMPGGGVNSENVMDFKKAGFESVHLSATVKKQLLKQTPKVSMHSAAFFEEGIVATSNVETIKEIIALLA